MTLSAERVASTPVERLHPSPWNPRTITDARFQQLCRSLESDPEFLWQRPILAMADGSVYAGNMRLRAALHLGWSDVPAIVADVPETLAKERALRDNNAYGAWEDDALATLLGELQAGGTDLDLLGFNEWTLQSLMGDAVSDPLGEWQGMPEFEQEDRTAYRTIHVHFADDSAVADFARLVDQAITEETKFVWYPEVERRQLGVYVSNES